MSIIHDMMVRVFDINISSTVNLGSESMEQCVPPTILSRFDLVYVIIGDLDDQMDYHIAHHIVRVNKKHEDALAPAFTTVLLKCYIVFAKSLKPKGVTSNPLSTIKKLEGFIAEIFAHVIGMGAPEPLSSLVWVSPERGWIKINVDKQLLSVGQQLGWEWRLAIVWVILFCEDVNR
ncbi:hypothetical protein HHK36_027296 [Tetracentron sinense]|uniref:MCM C-terminal AAA(+) ATPase domain-containing protein n=1 Tax=Tetracentron sinense TaxID=13715 RepID=A0A834YGK5_TETSI|nr:hypothetical protein HHK36_027296 [Tetracentron sinense]